MNHFPQKKGIPLNKLAVLAFTVLVSLSSILWYLANGSLNEYLKSQVELQGQYYTGQKASIEIADFSSSTGIGEFKNVRLLNLADHQAEHVLLIDVALITLEKQATQHLLTTLKTLTINKLTLNIENLLDSSSNIDQLVKSVSTKLALDYPELYPHISAEIYAKNNPELNAEEYAQLNPQAGPIVEHTKVTKKRGKPQAMLNISAIKINTVELNIINKGITKNIQLNDVNLSTVGGKKGIVSNQLGGEVLLALLHLAPQE